MAEGTVARVLVGKGFCFVSIPNESDVFLHASQLQGIAFDEQLEGRRLVFDLEDGPRGTRAVRARAAD